MQEAESPLPEEGCGVGESSVDWRAVSATGSALEGILSLKSGNMVMVELGFMGGCVNGELRIVCLKNKYPLTSHRIKTIYTMRY